MPVPAVLPHFGKLTSAILSDPQNNLAILPPKQATEQAKEAIDTIVEGVKQGDYTVSIPSDWDTLELSAENYLREEHLISHTPSPLEFKAKSSATARRTGIQSLLYHPKLMFSKIASECGWLEQVSIVKNNGDTLSLNHFKPAQEGGMTAGDITHRLLNQLLCHLVNTSAWQQVPQ